MSLDERFFHIHGHYPEDTRPPAQLPPHVTREAIMAVLDREMDIREAIQSKAHLIDAEMNRILNAAIGALQWAKTAIARLIDTPPPLTPEQHWRAEDAYHDMLAERYSTE